MNAIERLKRDHAILRSKLDILESALQFGPRMWFVLREVCFTLSRQLTDHIRREEELVARCRRSLSQRAALHITVEHRDEPQVLRTINRLFVETRGESLTKVRPVLANLIERLRRHMDEEEVELFPVLERELSDPAGDGRAGARPDGVAPLEETMTVNRIIQEHPTTQQVFRRLFVNVPFEGATCLDEVAWCHGMAPQELLQQLDQAITSEGF